MSPRNREKLPHSLRIALFCSSYFPLFAIIILKQCVENSTGVIFASLTLESLSFFFSKFGIASLLSLLSFYGLIGIFIFTRDMRKRLPLAGHTFEVVRVQNKNTESIGYIATYLVPFMFQSFSTPFEYLSFLILLVVIYVVYSHSTLIIVNPILNIRYSLYDIEYRDLKSDKVYQGSFIVSDHNILQGDQLQATSLGSNLHYAQLMEEE